MSSLAASNPPTPHRRVSVRFSVKENDSLSSLISFLIGILCFVRLQAIGVVYVSEIALAGLLPFLLISRGHLLRNPTVLTFLGLIGLWLFAQILSDITHETDFFNYARGWANIAVFLVNLCALYLLLHGSRRRFVLFALGLALGGILGSWIMPLEYFEMRQWNQWKFGIGEGVALLAVLAGLWHPIRRNAVLATLPLLAVSAYSLAVGYRSMFAVALIASLALLAQSLMRRAPSLSRAKSAFPAIGLLAGSLLAGLGSIEIYKLAATKGYLNESSRQVYETQAQGELGLLVGGRSSVFVSIPMILDSPILGYGSKTEEIDYATSSLSLRDYGYLVNPEAVPRRSVSHSMILGTWMEAGIGGVFFWICFVLLIVVTLGNLYLAREPLSLLIFYLGFSQLWHMAFSPFAGAHRLTTAFTFCLFAVALQVLGKSRSAISGVVPPVSHGQATNL